MAKRYYEYDRIPEGHFKPEGTLGRHFASVIRQDDKKIVIGNVAGHVVLHPGDTLGYNCGEVWSVPRPESYKDPVRRALALGKVSQRILTYTDEPIPDEWEVVNEADYSSKTTGALAMWDAPTRESESRRVTKILVSREADKTKVATWLEELLTKGGRERKQKREAAERSAAEELEAARPQAARVIVRWLSALAKEVESYHKDQRTYIEGDAEIYFSAFPMKPGFHRESYHSEPYYDLDALKAGIPEKILAAWGVNIPPAVKNWLTSLSEPDRQKS